MPFRQNHRLWTEPLEQQGRGGEPSLANVRQWLELRNRLQEQGRGMGEGSFTERIRRAFLDWLKKNGLTRYDTISFEYRLYRHKTIRVTLTWPNIYHRRLHGDGSKGFMLEGTVLSLDGLPPSHRNYHGEFALTRIIGRHPMRLLAEAEEVEHECDQECGETQYCPWRMSQ